MKCFWLVLLLCFGTASAQNYDLYELLRCEGDIPAEFTVSSTEKYEKQQRQSDRTGSRFDQKVRDRFYLETNFIVDDLLLSGRVIFNDPISDYVNRVGEEILRNQPQLQKKLRFYVVKSPVPNAYSTQQGIILVHLGLLARLETEAQLAFILCHEISHYTKQHVLNLFLENQNIAYGRGEYRKSSSYDKMVARSNYSKENEKEADAEGLKMFLQTKYRISDLPEIFDLLADMEHPYMPLFGYEDRFWNNEYVNKDDFIEKKELDEASKKNTKKGAGGGFLTDFDSGSENEDEFVPTDTKVEEQAGEGRIVQKIEMDEIEIDLTEAEDDDTFSTHPDPEKRKALIRELIEKERKKDGQLFVVSQEKFSMAQKRARFELVEMFVKSRAYFDAMIQILNLQLENPDSEWLNQQMIKALYGYSQYRYHGGYFPVVLQYDEESPSQRDFIKELRSLKGREILTLALSQSWSALKADSKNEYLQMSCQDLIGDLLNLFPDFTEISDERPVQQAVLGKMMQEKDFVALYEKARKARTDEQDWDRFSNSREGRKKIRAFEKGIRKRGYRLGIDKVVIFDPLYIRIDSRKKNPLQWIASEKSQSDFHSYIKSSAQKLDLDVEILDSKSLQSRNGAEVFNDIAVVNDWYQETLNHDEVEMVNSNYDKILKLREKYGTPYFAHMGAISNRDPNFFVNNAITLFYSIFLPPSIPYAIKDAVTPNEESLVFTQIFDVDRNERMATLYNEMPMKASKGILQTNIHYTLFQIKSKKKK
ncbi:MAG: M48 family metallopeptidase [Bacteroidota bacterium]